MPVPALRLPLATELPPVAFPTDLDPLRGASPAELAEQVHQLVARAVAITTLLRRSGSVLPTEVKAGLEAERNSVEWDAFDRCARLEEAGYPVPATAQVILDRCRDIADQCDAVYSARYSDVGLRPEVR
ncbi:MAG TPA: hypothetical protein VEB59_14570 [Gemmatimonadales bacterium]|nr:hypothetical protein [Gemmatimonadales bacterium]